MLHAMFTTTSNQLNTTETWLNASILDEFVIMKGLTRLDRNGSLSIIKKPLALAYAYMPTKGETMWNYSEVTASFTLAY